MTFDELDLDPDVLKAVHETGYTTPTPIQAQAIPKVLMARDVLGIAQTGTGKTAAFTLPMISILKQGRAKARMPRSLILCPTRELAQQVSENFDTYGKHTKLTKALLIGGVSFNDQDKLIDRGVDVLIATPGRLLDHFERGKLMLTGISILVVDEADRMLDMGFIPDIERIFKLTPMTRQTLFFSATMPPEITRLTQEFLSNPVRVEAAPPASPAQTVTQRLVRLRPAKKEGADREKREILRDLLRREGDELKNAIVFCNRKRDIGPVFRSLQKAGFEAGALHGDLEQSVRTATLDGFRKGEVRVLVASDVAARGLDIPSVSHVVNFDVPIHSEDYVHRIGRTGRAGRSGKAYLIALPHEEKHLEKIEALIGRKIDVLETRGETAEAAAPAPAAAEAPAETPKPKRSRSRKKAAAEAPAQAAPETKAERPAETPREAARGRETPPRGRGGREEPRGRRSGGGGRDEPVIGLGDHVPAFLLRDPRTGRRSAPPSAQKDEDASSEAA